MKTTIQINNKAVEIELTAEQVAEINRQSVNYTDIETFEDACKFDGIDVDAWLKKYGDLPSDVLAYMKLRIIAKALNGGEILDWKDASKYKYYPWFYSVGSSPGFSCRVYAYDYSNSAVGSRLLYKTAEIAKYAGKQFISIYNEYINAN